MLFYVEGNPKSKAEIKRQLAAGKKLRLFNPGLGGPPPLNDYVGEICGPHYPAPHKWYGSGVMKDGRLISIK
jgi:hypothetical protein